MSIKGTVTAIDSRTNQQTGEITQVLMLEVVTQKRLNLRTAELVNLYRPLIGKRIAIECEEGLTSTGRPYVSLIGNGSPELLASISHDPAPLNDEKPKSANPLFGGSK